jgi:hypothetical protein
VSNGKLKQMSQDLDEIEKRIKELEAEVAFDDKDEDTEIIEDDADEDEGLLPIPPLPQELVPPPGLLLSVGHRQVKQANGVNKQTGNKQKRVECKSCNEVFFTKDAFLKHSKTLKHRQGVILKAGAAYEPAHHEPNFCRACNLTFKTVDDLLAHRSTSQHKESNAKLARASYCFVCKKQFTSPLQLRGHIIGKAHNDMVERKTGYRPLESKNTSKMPETQTKPKRIKPS